MSKQKKGPGREAEHSSADQVSADLGLDPELAALELLGNQAFASQMTNEPAREAVPYDVIRDMALPLVERAGLALELRPEPKSTIERYVEILEASRLPDDQRTVLIDKLQADQVVATGISDLLGRHFGGDEIEVRRVLGTALDAVWDALKDGRGQIAGGRTATDQAGVLIGDLAAQMAPELGAHSDSVSESVSGFCRALFLAMYWDEEEEEDLEVGQPIVET